MAINNRGPVTWGAQRDDDGHRTYSITFRVEGDPGSSSSQIDGDGPEEVTNASDLPDVGDAWSYGNDNDPWAFCTPFVKIDPYDSGQKTQYWNLTYKFTTKPWVDPGGGGGSGGRGARLSFCSGGQIQNPLMEPDVIRGSFLYGSRKTTKDKDGFVIRITSFETVEIEIDENLPTVEIGQNVSNLDLATFTGMVNKVNKNTMWGLTAGKIKLSNVSWERRLWGICGFYYHRTFIFEINPNTFDFADLPNKGKKMIGGFWGASAGGPLFTPYDWVDVDEPLHYVEAFDSEGKPTEWFLDPLTGEPTDAPNFITPPVPAYQETNFLTLGLPTTIG